MTDKHIPPEDYAFPHDAGDFGFGLTTRDYFAAKALQGLCACDPMKVSGTLAELAERSYNIADQMMKRRAK